jgi:Protein of unknown function (DUF2971)
LAGQAGQDEHVTTAEDREISASGTALPAWETGSEPECIYHYTDSAGLLGILRSGALWATDVWFMNDAVEATYGWERIDRFLRSRDPQSDSERQVVEKATGIMKSLREREGDLLSYIACLSENGDQLSQWRAYGYGKGLSIGFDQSALKRLAASLPPPLEFTVRRVAYDEDWQDTLIDSHFHREVAALPSTVSDQEAFKAARMFVVWALNLAPALKHPAFREEAEVRLQIFLGPEADITSILKFRDSSMGVTPYVEIPLCEPGTDKIAVMREVIIGPQRHPAEAERAVRQLLASHGLSNVETKLSQVPLRS